MSAFEKITNILKMLFWQLQKILRPMSNKFPIIVKPFSNLKSNITSLQHSLFHIKKSINEFFKNWAVKIEDQKKGRNIGLFLLSLPFISLSSFITLLIKKTSPEIVLIIFVAIAIVGLSMMKMLGAGKRIYKGVIAPEVVIKKEFIDGKKKSYALLEARQLFVSDISLPVYIESAGSAKTLNLDITIQTSNRYIREYFALHEPILKNRLNQTLEPTIPSFPLDPEGSRILKQKIQNELTDLIRELELEGSVEDVYVHSIVGG